MNTNEVAGYLSPGGPGLTSSEMWFNKDHKWCLDVESSWLQHSTHSQQKPIPLIDTAVENESHSMLDCKLLCVSAKEQRTQKENTKGCLLQ